MKKLINLNVYDAKNMICVWNENNPEDRFGCGIALDDADRGFMIPRYYVVGVFDDGTPKAAGLFSLNDINQDPDDEDLFLFNEFLQIVSLDAAKAFVRHNLNDGSCQDEKGSKEIVYSKLLSSGVTITETARQYLTSEL